jgi:hypothetical protein
MRGVRRTKKSGEAIMARATGEVPIEYLRFVADYPILPDDFADVREREVFADVQKALVVNLEVRRRPPVDGAAWPDQYFVVGESGCGDWYCLDTSHSPAPVVCWNHETAAFEPTAHSLSAFLEHILRNP